MKASTFFVIAWAISISAFAQTSAPAAPTLTAGAEFKGLRFDWDTVPGATRYQLEYRAHQTGDFLELGDDLAATQTSTHFSFPLHLFDWTYARYRLAACNDAGCSRSAEVSVSGLRREAVGYFKAGQSKLKAYFGSAIDLSPDGYNLVVSAPGEVTQTSGGSAGGAVYTFRRGSNGKWIQRARLEPHATSRGDYVSLDVAISGSGNTVAVGQGSDVAGATNKSGQVDVFSLKNNVWTRTRIPRLASADTFSGVQLSESGYILAIAASSPTHSAAIYKSVNGVWQNVRNFSQNELGYQENCNNPVLSRDGSAIAELCFDTGSGTRLMRDYIRVHWGTNWAQRTDLDLDHPASLETRWFHSGFGMDRTGSTFAVQYTRDLDRDGTGEAWIQVITRNGHSWTDLTQINPGVWRNSADRNNFANSISISGDGHTMAIGDPADNGTSWGPRAAPLVAGTAQTGAVYVYRLTSQWRLINMVKPNYNPNPGSSHIFGRITALSQTGKTLVVAVPEENSSAKGIDGDWANSDLQWSGALFMY